MNKLQYLLFVGLRAETIKPKNSQIKDYHLNQLDHEYDVFRALESGYFTKLASS